MLNSIRFSDALKREVCAWASGNVLFVAIFMMKMKEIQTEIYQQEQNSRICQKTGHVPIVVLRRVNSRK